MTTRLHQIALGCTDLDRSVEFYTHALGEEPFARFDPPGIAFFHLGESRFMLERSDAVTPGDSTLYLPVPDLSPECERLRALGVVFESEPHLIHTDDLGLFGARGNEEWMAFFRDPDGHSLALVEIRSGPAK